MLLRASQKRCGSICWMTGVTGKSWKWIVRLLCSKCRLHGHNFESCRKRKPFKPAEGKDSIRPILREELNVEKGSDEVPKGNANANSNKDVPGKEWKEVVSRKRRNKASLQARTVDSLSNKGEVKVKGDGVTLADSSLKGALVIYDKGGVANSLAGLDGDAQMGTKSKKTLLSFNRAIPNDLSGAELKLRNDSKNVLWYDDELGVMFNPSHMAHYNQIQEKAGSMRKATMKTQSDSDEDYVRSNIPIEGGSMSSKHCSIRKSQ